MYSRSKLVEKAMIMIQHVLIENQLVWFVLGNMDIAHIISYYIIAHIMPLINIQILAV